MTRAAPVVNPSALPGSSRIVIPIVNARARPLIGDLDGQKDPDGTLHDLFGRRLHDLRISLTDRCNFRCTYCMPKEIFDREHRYLPYGDLLTFEEIARLARIFVSHGVEKVRLTGGEPLLRKHVERLIAMLASIALPGGGTLDLALTTNGSLLRQKAVALKAAGLKRLTVSLDALDDERFRAMNDVDYPVTAVLEGIDAAVAAGFASIKVNMVVKRGVNDDQVGPMASRFRDSGQTLRLIEFMDVGSSNGWTSNDVVTSAELIRRIDAEWPIEPIEAAYPGEVAERWRYRDGSGEIGFVSSVSQPFCADCSRARISPEGKLYTCLFAREGTDLRGPLRAGGPDLDVARLVGLTWTGRDDRYSVLRDNNVAAAGPKIEMSYIGG